MSRRRNRYASGKGEDVHDKAALLNALGHCRRQVLAAQDSVRPFGVTYAACDLVKRAIDSLATYLTGEPTFFAADGSTAMPGRLKWEGRAAVEVAEQQADLRRPSERTALVPADDLVGEDEAPPSEDDGVAQDG